jgi:arylsulfatase A-like enzyme
MTIDVLPTVATLGGAPLPADADGYCTVAGRRIDGHDRWPLFRGEKPVAEAAPPVYSFWFGDNELQAVREGRWKLFLPHTTPQALENRLPGSGGVPGGYRPLEVGRELYDLGVDPGEKRDVAADHPDVVARLEAIAERSRAELGDRLNRRTGVGVRSPDSVVPRQTPRPAE